MFVLGQSITFARDSTLGHQNTPLFLEALIVGMFVFLTIALIIGLGFLSKYNKPDVSIVEVDSTSQLNMHNNLLQEDSLIKFKDI